MIHLYLTLIEEESDKIRFEAAYWEYRDLMFYVAKQILQDDHLAEDAVQEAFLRIARNFAKVGDVESMKTKNFFAMITKNVALSHLEAEQKHWSKRSTDEEDGEEHSADKISVPDSAFESYSYGRLLDAVRSLPERYGQVLYLLGVYEYSIKETANLLGLSTETVKKRAQRGRKLLAKLLAEEEKIL